MNAGKIIAGLSVLAGSLLLCSCSEYEDDPPVWEGENPEMPGAEETHMAMLVYMVADNSLGAQGFDKADLREMQSAINDGKLGDNGRLLVYHNSRGTSSFNPPVLFEVLPNGVTDTLMVYPDPFTLSVDPDRMATVIADFEMLAPAKHKGLVLWSHGTGWVVDKGTLSLPVLRSFGNDRGSKMSIPALARGLAHSSFDFIHFDCCHMATVEVAYELRHLTPYIIGSVTELAAEGMPYHEVLPYYFDIEGPNPIGAAKAEFEYFDRMTGENRTCTLSVISTQELDALADATREMLLQNPDNGLPLSQYQRFMRSSNTLYDMGQWAENLVGVDGELLDKWKVCLANAVPWYATTPSVFEILFIDHFEGLACYIPTNLATCEANGYTDLQWWKDVVSYYPRFNTTTE